MTRDRVLIKHASVGSAPVAFRCNKCKRVFPVPGGDLTDEQKVRTVQTEFDKHSCDEDASQPAVRVAREATKD